MNYDELIAQYTNFKKEWTDKLRQAQELQQLAQVNINRLDGAIAAINDLKNTTKTNDNEGD